MLNLKQLEAELESIARREMNSRIAAGKAAGADEATVWLGADAERSYGNWRLWAQHNLGWLMSPPIVNNVASAIINEQPHEGDQPYDPFDEYEREQENDDDLCFPPRIDDDDPHDLYTHAMIE